MLTVFCTCSISLSYDLVLVPTQKARLPVSFTSCVSFLSRITILMSIAQCLKRIASYISSHWIITSGRKACPIPIYSIMAKNGIASIYTFVKQSSKPKLSLCHLLHFSCAQQRAENTNEFRNITGRFIQTCHPRFCTEKQSYYNI